MNMINITRNLRGYIKFGISGGFGEDFINNCIENGILLWDIKIDSDGIFSAKIIASDFYRLRKPARISGVKIKIINKRGLPFFIKRNRKRRFLFFGIIFYLIFVFSMNQRIWFINVAGSENVGTREIINLLETYGFKRGVKASETDVDLLNRLTVNHFEHRLVWASINIRGSVAEVELKDYKDELENTEFGDPCNIVADFDGVILSVEIINGDAVTESGNGVKKGDILISGVIQNRDLSAEYLEAKGVITAFHKANYNINYTYKENDFLKIGEYNKIMALFLPDITLSGYENETDKIFYSYSELLEINGISYPFGVTNMYFAQYRLCENRELLFLLALDDFSYSYYKEFSNTLVIDSSLKVIKTENGYTVRSESDCIDFIGIKNPIYVNFE